MPPHLLSNLKVAKEWMAGDTLDGHYRVNWLTLSGLPSFLYNDRVENYIGIDPGRNFGVAMIQVGGSASMGWGTFPKEEHQWKYGLWSFDYAKHFDIDACMGVVVEGAAYNVFKGKGNINPGQVGLAEVRFGFVLGLREAGVLPQIVPPATIRKGVFGHGRLTEQDIWPGFNKNGGSALACALYASGYRHDPA